jgi:hypothetical protein
LRFVENKHFLQHGSEQNRGSNIEAVFAAVRLGALTRHDNLLNKNQYPKGPRFKLLKSSFQCLLPL